MTAAITNTALLVIDWEKEWINPDSDYYIGSDLYLETNKLNKLIGFARSNQLKIIFVKHIELEGGNFEEDRISTEFIDTLDVREVDTVIKKNKISSFYKTNLEDELEGIDSLVIAGILTNLCVRSAVHDAYDREFDITIVKDCCVTFDNEIQEFTLSDLKTTRPEIEIVLLEELMS